MPQVQWGRDKAAGNSVSNSFIDEIFAIERTITIQR